MGHTGRWPGRCRPALSSAFGLALLYKAPRARYVITMRAVIARKPGGVEVLEIVELEAPRPGPGELLVRCYAAALNRADLLQRRGLYPPPPGDSEVLGLEYAGEVAEVGPGVVRFRRGDPVFGIVGGGAYAELLRVHESLAVPVPDTLSFEKAAALPEAFITAGESLHELAQLQPGENLLVPAAASGVGSAAIQLGCAHGARVVATAGSQEKLELALRLGASSAVSYRQSNLHSVVREGFGGRGADVILDLVGASQWDLHLSLLEEGGRLVVVGLVGGSRVALDLATVLHRRLRMVGTALRNRSLADKAALTARFRERVMPLLLQGAIRPVLDRIYPLEEVREAHARMEANLNLGKIVLRL